MPSLLKSKDESSFTAPPSVYNYRVYLLAISAAMGSAMFGYDSAFVGGAISLPSFTSRFGLDDAEGDDAAALSANIVSTFQAGCFFGAIFVSYFAERFGRRWPLVVCGVVFNLGAVLQLAAEGRLGLIYAGRAFTGLAVGASSLVVPQYISEWSPPAIRGRLVGIFEIILQVSQIIGFWVNYGVNKNLDPTSDSQWQIPFGLQIAPGTLLAVLMLFQPDSPRWLIKSGQTAAAQKSLSRVRHLKEDDAYIRWEIATIRERLDQENEAGANKSLLGKLKLVFSKSHRNRLFLGMALMILQNLSGINALNYFSPSIFESIGIEGTDVGLLATGIFGVVKCTATALFMIFGIDRMGRRQSMLIGSCGALIAMFYLAGYSKVSGSFVRDVPMDAGAYIAIVMVYWFAVFYAISWNGIPWIFCSEVFPTAIRSVCLVFTTCTQWLGQFIIVYSTPYMMQNITYGTFLFFGSSIVVGIVVIFVFMPETKGLSLEEMDILFGIPGLASTQRKKAEAIIAEQRAAEAVVDPEKLEAAQVEKV